MLDEAELHIQHLEYLFRQKFSETQETRRIGRGKLLLHRALLSWQRFSLELDPRHNQCPPGEDSEALAHLLDQCLEPLEEVRDLLRTESQLLPCALKCWRIMAKLPTWCRSLKAQEASPLAINLERGCA